MRVAAIGVVVVLGVTSCSGENGDDDQPYGDGGQCQCPAPTAQQVSFDPASSMLGATNLQDAIDELATRPKEAEPPLKGRLTLIRATPDNPGNPTQLFVLDCPAGDIPLGGGCGLLLGGDLQSGELTESGYGCIYEQDANNVNKPKLSVMCFTPVQ